MSLPFSTRVTTRHSMTSKFDTPHPGGLCPGWAGGPNPELHEWAAQYHCSLFIAVNERTGVLSPKRRTCTHPYPLCLSLTTVCQFVQNWLHSCDAASDLYAPGTVSERSGLNLQQQSRSHSANVVQ